MLEVRAKKRQFSENECSEPMIVPSRTSYKLSLDSTEYELTAKIK
jgi:hypothetical protein